MNAVHCVIEETLGVRNRGNAHRPLGWTQVVVHGEDRRKRFENKMQKEGLVNRTRNAKSVNPRQSRLRVVNYSGLRVAT